MILISDYVRLKRAERGMTQKALSERTGLDRGYLSRLEKNHFKKPSITVLSKLSNALSVPLTDLLRACDLENSNIASDKLMSFEEFVIRKFDIDRDVYDVKIDDLLKDFFRSYFRHFRTFPRSETNLEQSIKLNLLGNMIYEYFETRKISEKDHKNLSSRTSDLEHDIHPLPGENREEITFLQADKRLLALAKMFGTAIKKTK